MTEKHSNTDLPRKEDEKEDLASVAADYFIKASRKYPASMVGQGGFILKLSRQSGHKPRELGDSLLADLGKIDELVAVAKKVHRSIGVEVGLIDRGRMRNIVHSDFRFAEEMSVLDSDEVEKALGLYQDFETEGLTGTGLYENAILGMIEEKFGHKA